MDFRLYFRSRQGELVHLLKQLVMLESPTQDKKAVDVCASFAARELKRVGCKITVHPQKEVGDLVVAEFAPGRLKDADDEILVLTHIDTVWPVGKIVKMPFYVREQDLRAGRPGHEGRAGHGPGRPPRPPGAQRQAPEEDHGLHQFRRGDRARTRRPR